MKILAIESSCDETAAAVVEEKNGKINVLSNLVYSQIEIHQKTQGVVPEVAARAHIEKILPIIDQALIKASETKNSIDAIAVTSGPGLVGSLLVGVSTAKALASVWKKPIFGVNHLAGHLYACFIENDIKLPAVVLTASGGHTMLILVEKIGKIKILGETIDDAAGEAFDKVAKLLGLGYPGGPAISKYADKFLGKEQKIHFPRPLMNSGDYNFSFSGLKTAVLYAIKKDYPEMNNLTDEYKEEVAYAFQEAAVDVLTEKALRAAGEYNVKTICLSGGVSANTRLRERMGEKAKEFSSDIEVIVPSFKYCTDNAAMIGAAALLQRNIIKPTTHEHVKADPNFELAE
ncbi:MAG: tRNA (adenosine(37)-N6)-threonylcarbamoyltransferase complex transferase subunit TsaD [Patescibacteria group bacterium]|jgi:N6-L-threonylcarbamoyladenine synthase